MKQNLKSDKKKRVPLHELVRFFDKERGQGLQVITGEPRLGKSLATMDTETQYKCQDCGTSGILVEMLNCISRKHIVRRIQ